MPSPEVVAELLEQQKRKNHWFQWFGRDYLGDSDLQLCSLAARGIAANFFSYTGSLSPSPGFFVLATGVAPTMCQTALILHCTENEAACYLTELLSAKVIKQTADGVLYSMRQVRQFNRSESSKIGGKKRGEQISDGKYPDASFVENQEVDSLRLANAKRIAQRAVDVDLGSDQDPEKSTTRASGSPPPVMVTPERGGEIWNEVCVPAGLSKITKLTPKRRAHFLSRLRERDSGRPRDESWLRMYLGRIVSSDFCRGASDTRWRADFDFAFRSEDVVVKVLEGAYDNRAALPKRSDDRGRSGDGRRVINTNSLPRGAIPGVD